MTRHTGGGEGFRETLPGLSVGDFLAFAADSRAATDELVGSHATKRKKFGINEIRMGVWEINGGPFGKNFGNLGN